VLIRGSKPVDSALPGDFKSRYSRTGSVFILVVVCMIVLAALGVGMLTVSWGARRNAIMLKSEATAMLAAEAGYEKAVYWMSKQPDMLNALEAGASGTAGALSFPDSRCNYQIKLYTFLGSRPIYQVLSNGYSGAFCRMVDVYVVQAISGWDMGMCRVPSGPTSTSEVYFAAGEEIDIPIQINNLKDSPDNRDIYISGSPRFKQLVSMGEPRYTSGGTDKYASVMGLFEQGICFSQPDSKITDEAAVQSKVDRFIEGTKGEFKFNPVATAPVTNPNAAVQIEFFVDAAGQGKVAITNNCTVCGFKQDSDSKTCDFRIKPKSDGKTYERYYIYAYHVAPDGGGAPVTVTYPIEETYVTQSYGEYESEPGGQIFVEGNVIIGGNNTLHGGDQVIKGDVMVVATGNIWIADSIIVDGPHQADRRPSPDNPNVLGLMAQGVIKVVDPGISGYPAVAPNNYPGPPTSVPAGYIYAPVARPVAGGATYDRYLPDPTEVEAAITIGGGGWGAENVIDRSLIYGGRKEYSPPQDYLCVRGTLVEAIRGVVGRIGSDGYLKRYYFDERLLEGILPANIWLRGKYVPAPAGWHDYRSGG
jgi:hypothetical protein